MSVTVKTPLNIVGEINHPDGTAVSVEDGILTVYKVGKRIAVYQTGSWYNAMVDLEEAE
jgi:hypothetical protein